jgi:hypothetical protein
MAGKQGMKNSSRMYDDFARTRLIRLAWKASTGARFSEVALVEAAAALAEEKFRPKLRQALPAVWLHLDDAGAAEEWLAATGLDGDTIDAINAAIGAGLPQPAKKASLHEYALRPQDFPALLFLSFVAARLATPYMGGGPHRKVRDQFWYAPELAVIVMRCLPPKLDLLAVEHVLRTIMQAPAGERPGLPTYGIPPMIGEPPSPYGIIETTMGMIELPEDLKENE